MSWGRGPTSFSMYPRQCLAPGWDGQQAWMLSNVRDWETKSDIYTLGEWRDAKKK